MNQDSACRCGDVAMIYCDVIILQHSCRLFLCHTWYEVLLIVYKSTLYLVSVMQNATLNRTNDVKGQDTGKDTYSSTAVYVYVSVCFFSVIAYTLPPTRVYAIPYLV